MTDAAITQESLLINTRLVGHKQLTSFVYTGNVTFVNIIRRKFKTA